jgi:hypothetical protein
MKHDQTTTNATDPKGDQPFWSSGNQTSRAKVIPLLPNLYSNQSNTSRAFNHWMFTLVLTITLVLTFLLVAVALNGLLVWALLATGVMSGLLRMLVTQRTRRTTPVVPKASDRHRAGLKKVA